MDALFFFFLLSAHMIYDWHIQGDTLGKEKANNVIAMIVHCLTYALVIGLVIYFYIHFFDVYLIFMIFLSHILIDTTKVMELKQEKNMGWNKAVLFDQFMHIMLLAILSTLPGRIG